MTYARLVPALFRVVKVLSGGWAPWLLLRASEASGAAEGGSAPLKPKATLDGAHDGCASRAASRSVQSIFALHLPRQFNVAVSATMTATALSSLKNSMRF